MGVYTYEVYESSDPTPVLLSTQTIVVTAAAIPTADEWALIALAAALGAIGAFAPYLKR